jgi:uncharacterized protein YndB with AHSA1/START domain
MASNTPGDLRILGSLRIAGDTGAVRIEDRLDARIDDLWSALTHSARLAQWHAQVDGDLRPGGVFRIYLEADDWEGTGRVEACEPPRRFVVRTRETDDSWRKGQGVPPFDELIEVTLTADGAQTVLVVDVSGLPIEPIAFYGTGWQIHVENLAAHLAGRQRADAESRWGELVPAYQALASEIG